MPGRGRRDDRASFHISSVRRMARGSRVGKHGGRGVLRTVCAEWGLRVPPSTRATPICSKCLENDGLLRLRPGASEGRTGWAAC